MTERWRKRLSDLDEVTPSEDVFHRAHDGPQMPDEMIPRPSTGTRVVTGIAAFVVFALAISVFAIPALRMNRDAGSPAGVGLLPLWPARALDDLEALQARADSGEPDAVWATDPAQAARRFGTDVMGWFATNVDESPPAGGEQVIVDDYVPPPWLESNAEEPCPDDVACKLAGDYITMRTDVPSAVYPTGYPTSGYTTTVPPLPYRTYSIQRCEKGCSGNLTVVTLYQPLQAGDGSIWAVLEVRSLDAWFNVETAQAIDDGFAIKGGASVSTSGSATLGYRSGIGSCDVRDTTSGNAPVWNETRRIEVGLTPGDDMGCADAEAGYVWLGVDDADDGTDVMIPPTDPFDQDADEVLVALTAVPVTFQRGTVSSPNATEATEGVTPPPSVFPSPTPVAWSTREALGFSIDLPSDWDIWSFQGPLNGFRAGPDQQGTPYIEIFVDETAPAEDDSAFPLVVTTLESDDGTESLFRGDGRLFRLRFDLTNPIDGSTRPDEFETVAKIVASIRFEPWTVGETRNGWTAIDRPREDQSYWAGVGGNQVIAAWTGDGFVIVDAVDTCGEGQNMTVVDGWPVLECPDGTTVSYDVDGSAFPDNPPEYRASVDVYPAISAYDGHLLAELP